jgi:hypothetical protein
MSNDEKIAELRKILKPIIEWYRKVEGDGEPDSSYLYDTTHEVFSDYLSRGDYQSIIEILK